MVADIRALSCKNNHYEFLMAEMAHLAQLLPWLEVSDWSVKRTHLTNNALHLIYLWPRVMEDYRREVVLLHFLVSVVGKIPDTRRENPESTEPGFTA